MNKVVAGRGNLVLFKDAESSSNSEMLKMRIFTSTKKINFLFSVDMIRRMGANDYSIEIEPLSYPKRKGGII